MRRLANTSRRRRSKKIRRVVSRGLVNTKSLSFDGVNDKAVWAANTTIPNLVGGGDHAWSYWVKKPDFSVGGSGFQSTLIYALFFYGGGLSSFVLGPLVKTLTQHWLVNSTVKPSGGLAPIGTGAPMRLSSQALPTMIGTTLSSP